MRIRSIADLGAQIERFAARFGLTVAEARFLAEIIGGEGLLAAAARLKVTRRRRAPTRGAF